MKKLCALLFVLFISGCNDNEPNARAVLSAFSDSGLKIEDIELRDPKIKVDLPAVYLSSYKYRLREDQGAFNTKGGQILTCDSKELCDQLIEYFKKWSDSEGGNYFQSKSGVVVAQMGKDVSLPAITKIKQVLEKY